MKTLYSFLHSILSLLALFVVALAPPAQAQPWAAVTEAPELDQAAAVIMPAQVHAEIEKGYWGAVSEPPTW